MSPSPSLSPGQRAALQDGCYFIRYIPKEPTADIPFLEGTVRVLRVGPDGKKDPNKGELRAGGDLYRRTPDAPAPDPMKGIPVFPRRDYKYYLEVDKILDSSATGFTARFKVHEFDQNTKWPNPGRRTIILKVAEPPKDPKYPKHEVSGEPLYFTGTVMDQESSEVVGTVEMGWVSKNIRSARLLVDCVKGIKAPAPEETWKKVFDEIGWEVTVGEREITAIKSDPADLWTVGELHNAMLQAKEKLTKTKKKKITLNLVKGAPAISDPRKPDLVDTKWCYHLMCVPKIDGFDRGVMYDTAGTDSNNMPREGAAVAASFNFPADKFKNSDDARWGGAANKNLHEIQEAYFRVAMHELGHAMGLDHNHNDPGFMNTTDAIADGALERCAVMRKQALDAAMAAVSVSSATNSIDHELKEILGRMSGGADTPRQLIFDAAKKALDERDKAEEAKFPKGIKHQFHPDDLHRLRFGPDVTVRPGTRFEDSGPLFGDNRGKKAQGLSLKVSPLLEAVPIGAPVRVRIMLINTSPQTRTVPEDLSLNSGLVWGQVIPPTDGQPRTFWPVKKCGDAEKTITLSPGESRAFDLTLLRGPQAQLFPTRGRHRVIVRVTWEAEGATNFLQDETEVYVTQAVDDGPHASAAATVLATPDVLLSLAIGGDHLKEGRAAIRAALDDEVLRPHFAIVRIKEHLMARRFDRAWPYLDDTTVLSLSEIWRIATLIKDHQSAIKDRNAVVEPIKVLQRKLSKVGGIIGPSRDVDKVRELLEKLAGLFP